MVSGARSALALAVLLAAVASLAPPARAQDLATPAWVRSVEVIETGVTVRAGPSTNAPRRGTVRLGTFLPVEARVRGLGTCPMWFRIGVDAFVCESLVRLSAEPPHGDTLPIVPAGELLPRRYAFVASDGTWAYARPSDYFVDEMVESLGRGFGLAITEERVEQGVRFFRSQRGVWVPEEVVRFARGSTFEGVEITDGVLDVAWVARPSAELRAWTGRGPGALVRRLGRRDVVHVVAELGRGLLRTTEGVVRARDVIRTTSEPPPAELREGERWIDVDLTTQTLVAYEGSRPVFATLVSTGRASPGHETPVGVHRIWVKLAEDTMDDLDVTDQASNYAIEAVPWVQYFSEGVGLHAAFWHDDFGRPRSHGCVNLSPRDARRLFAWTSPELRPGWDAILTTEAQPGTIVRVRGRAARR
ncbi:MAG: hypothetical protein OHK0013_15410 [Sandaracinaceae bacterium]